MSGGTSQPNLNTLVEALRSHDRDTGSADEHLDAIAEYWRAVREFYTPFESPPLPAAADLYQHEMPGGQYTNLYPAGPALGLADRWREVCRVYADVNQLFGDIVKVTPTSKAVGDMALFLVANDMTADDVLDENRELAFPQSVVDLVSGRMGQTPGGFPPRSSNASCAAKSRSRAAPARPCPPPTSRRPREKLKAAARITSRRAATSSRTCCTRRCSRSSPSISSHTPTRASAHPGLLLRLEPGEEIAVDIEPGKTLIIKGDLLVEFE